MARRHSSQLREINPDPVYGDKLVSKFINCLLEDGKKSVAESIFYGAIDKIKSNAVSQTLPDDDSFKEKIFGINDDLKLFYLALYNVTPQMEVRSRRVGGATYQVPIEVSKRRSQALSIRWLIDAAKKGSAKTMRDRLAKEILDASSNSGVAVKKKEDTHKMAKANRAFAHYRW